MATRTACLHQNSRTTRDKSWRMSQWACRSRGGQYHSIQATVTFSRISPYRLFWCRHAVLVDSHPFCKTLDLQLSSYRPLCCNSRALLQCLRATGAILSGAHSYFVVSSFQCEGKNSYHDLIPNPLWRDSVVQKKSWLIFVLDDKRTILQANTATYRCDTRLWTQSKRHCADGWEGEPTAETLSSNKWNNIKHAVQFIACYINDILR